MFGILKKTITDKTSSSKSTYMSVTNLSTHFKLTPIQLNKIFSELKWAEQNDKWWIPTKLGKSKGGLEKYNAQTKQKYIVWNESIKNNFELLRHVKHVKEVDKHEIMSDKQKKVKGDIYEEFIYNIYKKDDYIVAAHGKDNGKEDCGIDLIAIKDKEILFIQCKNWNSKNKNKITDSHIKKTRMEVIDYIEETVK